MVYEHLTSESVKGDTERSDKFKEDKSIPKHLRATLADYKGSGFDRGHQAPAADHRQMKRRWLTRLFIKYVPAMPAAESRLLVKA